MQYYKSKSIFLVGILNLWIALHSKIHEIKCLTKLIFHSIHFMAKQLIKET